LECWPKDFIGKDDAAGCYRDLLAGHVLSVPEEETLGQHSAGPMTMNPSRDTPPAGHIIDPDLAGR